MKKKCMVRVEFPTKSTESPYYAIYNPETKHEIAWGKQIAMTPCNDVYTTGGSDVKGYRFVSPQEMQQIVDSNIAIDVHYEIVKCDSPCGMCNEVGCLGKEYPVQLMNKVIIEWKTS